MFLVLVRLVAAQAVFPSDGKLPAEADGAGLLQSVCPGKVEVGKETGCGKTCPAYTGFAGDDLGWTLARVTRGHFLSPTSDDAALFMEGCEPHSENWGGTILLTRESQGWVMKWYKAGVETSQCHKVALQSAREILVCLGETGGQGFNSTELYVEDLLHPAATLMGEDEAPFFAADDDTLTCGYDEELKTTSKVTRAFIEKVEFSADTPAAISVTAGLGETTVTTEEALACMKHRDGSEVPSPPVKIYHLDFFFNGHDYQPAVASKESARTFERE